MNIFKISLIILSLFIPNILLAEVPTIGKYPTMFKSGVYTITMLRLGEESNNTVLIKVDGIDNSFDGQIYKHVKQCENTNCTSYKYETKEIPGKEHWWTIQARDSWGDYENTSFYPPGISKKSSIYKIKRPANFDANKFYKDYLGQVALR